MTFSEAFQQWDGNLLVGIQHSLNADWLTPVMKALSYSAEYGGIFIILCIILLLCRKTRKLGIVVSAALALTFICCNLGIKPMVDRIRPWTVIPEVHAMLPPPGDASFPSGHSANSMGAAWALWLYTLPAKIGGRKSWTDGSDLGWKCRGADRRKMHMLGTTLVLLSVLIGISRLYLGMHYPSDVVCGLLLGMICATIVHLIFTKLDSKSDTILED